MEPGRQIERERGWGGRGRERAVLHLHDVVGRVDIVHSCTVEFY